MSEKRRTPDKVWNHGKCAVSRMVQLRILAGIAQHARIIMVRLFR